MSTLELDVQITEDGQAVVTHDRKIDSLRLRTVLAERGFALPKAYRLRGH